MYFSSKWFWKIKQGLILEPWLHYSRMFHQMTRSQQTCRWNHADGCSILSVKRLAISVKRLAVRLRRWSQSSSLEKQKRQRVFYHHDAYLYHLWHASQVIGIYSLCKIGVLCFQSPYVSFSVFFIKPDQ